MRGLLDYIERERQGEARGHLGGGGVESGGDWVRAEK